MNVEQAIDVFHHMDADHKALALAHLSNELTIVARDAYEAGSEEVRDGRRLRRINELQHRITAALAGVLEKAERFPDDVLVRIIFEGNDRAICAAFERVTNSVPASGE